jgi:calcium-dependent protein kinase
MVTINTFESATKFNPEIKLHEKIGTPYYIAPEVLNKFYGPKCDIWSLGVIAYICLYAKAPFEGDTDEKIMKNVKTGRLNLF